MLGKIKVGILDLGINNIQSIFSAFKISGYKTQLVKPEYKKYNYDILVLPGVGAFPKAMDIIRKNKVDEKIMMFLNNKDKILYGICLGMQIFFNQSEEFQKVRGLGLINGNVLKFKKRLEKNAYNIGWRPLIKNKFSNSTQNLNNKMFYFVHGFYVESNDINSTEYYSKFNNQKFTAMVKKDNIFGTQFHPEKSGKDGIQFIKNIRKLI